MSHKAKRRSVKLIANPGAGDPIETPKNLELAARYMQECGLIVDVALAHPKKGAVSIVKKAVKDGYETVIAMGGDGTIETIMRAILDLKPRFARKVHLGILPSGTANNIAKSLGIPEDIKEACRLIEKNYTRQMDVGQVKTKKYKKFYFFEMVAIGLTAALYPDAKEIPDGKLSSIKEAIATLIQHDPNPKVTLKMDGESVIEVETLLVTVSNTPEYGMNFLVAPDASLDDGLLNISVYPNYNKADLLAYYAKVMNEGDSEDGQIQRYRARKLEVKSSSKLEVMADGEMLGKGKAKIKVRQGALTLIVPTQNAGIAVQTDTEAVEQLVPLPLPSNVAVSE